MEDNILNNLKIIRLMNGTHGYTAERLRSVVSNESLLSDYTNGKKMSVTIRLEELSRFWSCQMDG